MIFGPLRHVSVRFARDDLVPGRPHVARHVQIEIAVGVGVEERAARAPAAGRDAGLRRDVLEGAVALVPEQHVGAPVGDVEIDAAVAVGVARADALSPGREIDAGLRRHVLEAPAAQIAEERVAMRDALPRRGQLGAGDDVDVEPSVAVVVEERDAVAAGLEDVVLGRTAAVGGDRKRRGFLEGDGRRDRRHRRGAAGWPRPGRTHAGGVAAVDRILDLRLAVAALEGETERDLALEADAGALQQREDGRGVEPRVVR